MFVTANYPSAPVIKLAGIIIKHYSHLPIKDLDLLNTNDQDIKCFEEDSRKKIWREFISSPEYDDFNINKLTVGELDILGFNQITGDETGYDLWLFPSYFYDMIPFGTKTYNILDCSWSSDTNSGLIWGIDNFGPIRIMNQGNLNIGIRRKKDSDYIFRVDVPKNISMGSGGNGVTRSPIDNMPLYD